MTVSTGLAERLQARRWSRLRTGLAAVGLLAVVAVGVWVVLFSRVLAVRSVEVTGVGRLTAADVASAAAVRSGTPLLRLDTAAVARRVGALPAVRSVDVGRRWPGSVEIVVRERVPAAVRMHGTSYLLVDRTGVAFATVTRRPRRLPLISAPVDAGRPALRAALDVLAATPPVVRRQLRVVRAANAEHVTLRLRHGRVVVWGSPEQGERKAAVLEALLTRKAKVYDVSAPDAPTTRKKF